MADIVLVEDEQILKRTLVKTLEDRGHTVREADSAEQALAMMEPGPPDLLLTDDRLPDMSGRAFLQRLKDSHPNVGVVIITADGTVEGAAGALRDGAADYLRKPIDLNELCLVVDRCLETQSLRKELDYYRWREFAASDTSGIVGESPAIRQLRALVGRLASLEKRDGLGPTILLIGENGTGKGLTARAIHQASSRAKSPFIEVNCTAIPDNLLEAEVMGYERGAFSEAASAKAGLFEAAEGGTLFIDEIGQLSKSLQASLLKVLDEKAVRRLGSTRDRQTRCTVTAATRMDLRKEVAAGRFLGELLERIEVVTIELPPLRNREDDVLLLADHFLKLHAKEYGVAPPKLSPSAIQAIKSHPWPGNVRELSHTLERAIVMHSGDVIEDRHLALQTEPPHASRLRITRIDDLDVDFTEGAIRLEDVEVGLIRRAMEFTRGNQVQSAKLLGLSRDALRYRLEKYKLR